jgi:homeobox protein cut-like
MQSYREEAGSRPPVSQLDPLPAPADRDDMRTYKTRYEEAMNPFEAFRGRVSGIPGFTLSRPLLFDNP